MLLESPFQLTSSVYNSWMATNLCLLYFSVALFKMSVFLLNYFSHISVESTRPSRYTFFHCSGNLSMCILLMLLFFFFSFPFFFFFMFPCSSAAVSPRNILNHRFLLCANSLNAKKSSCFHMEAFKLFLTQKTNIFWQLQRNSACSGISIQTPLHLLDNHFGMRGSFKSRILSSISFLSHNKIQSLWSPDTLRLLPASRLLSVSSRVQWSLVFLSYRRSSPPAQRVFRTALRLALAVPLQPLCFTYGSSFYWDCANCLPPEVTCWCKQAKCLSLKKDPCRLSLQIQPSLPVLVPQVPRVGLASRLKGKEEPHQEGAHHAARFLPVPTPLLPMMCGAACGKPQLAAELSAELGPTFELVEVSMNTTSLGWFTQDSYHCVDVTLQPLNQHLLLVLCSGNQGPFGARTGDLWMLTVQWKYSTPNTEFAVPNTFPLQIPLFRLLLHRVICFILHKDGSRCSWEHRLYNFLLSCDSIMPDKSLFHLARPSVASRYSDKNRCQDVLSFLIVKKDCKTIFSTDGCELALSIQAFSIFILNYFCIFLHRAMMSRASGKVNNDKAKKFKVNLEFLIHSC